MEAPAGAEVRRVGGGALRGQLAIAAATGRAIEVQSIRERETEPGLHAHELLLLRMLEHITTGSRVDISPSGTAVRVQPGALVGTETPQQLDVRESDRSVSYFLEPLLILGCLCKHGLTFSLVGVTSDAVDPPASSFSRECSCLLSLVGIPARVDVTSEGFHPRGDGEVRVYVPPAGKAGIPNPLDAVDIGLFRRIRGGATSSRCANAAKDQLKHVCPDTLVRGASMRKSKSSSPGIGAYVVAESMAGKCIGAGYALPENHEGKLERQPPEHAGERASKELLHIARQGGCIGPSCQALAAYLCALGPAELSRVRIGPPTKHLISTLLELQAIAGVTFNIEEDPAAQPSVLLSTVGLGIRPVARRAR